MQAFRFRPALPCIAMVSNAWPSCRNSSSWYKSRVRVEVCICLCMLCFVMEISSSRRVWDVRRPWTVDVRVCERGPAILCTRRRVRAACRERDSSKVYPQRKRGRPASTDNFIGSRQSSNPLGKRKLLDGQVVDKWQHMAAANVSCRRRC